MLVFCLILSDEILLGGVSQHWQGMKERYRHLLIIVCGTVLPAVANKHPPWLQPDAHSGQSAMNDWMNGTDTILILLILNIPRSQFYNIIVTIILWTGIDLVSKSLVLFLSYGRFRPVGPVCAKKSYSTPLWGHRLPVTAPTHSERGLGKADDV